MYEDFVKKQNGVFANVVLGPVPKHGSFAQTKRICKTEYKCVSLEIRNGVLTFVDRIKQYKWTKYFSSCRKAALAVDMKFIEKGKSPRNILFKRELQNINC